MHCYPSLKELGVGLGLLAAKMAFIVDKVRLACGGDILCGSCEGGD